MKRNKKGKSYCVGCNLSFQVSLEYRSSLPRLCATRLKSIPVSEVLSFQSSDNFELPRISTSIAGLMVVVIHPL